MNMILENTGQNEVFIKLVNDWRKAFEKLTPEEKAQVQNLNSLNGPCQIMAVILQNKELGITEQTWIISHFSDENDLSIKVIGPLDGINTVNALSELMKEEKFDRSLPPNTWFLGAKVYRDVIEGHLLSLIDSFRTTAVQRIWTGKGPNVGITSKFLLGNEVSVWQFNGLLLDRSIDEIVENEIKIIKQSIIRPAPNQEQNKEIKENIQGNGTIIYPNVWIGARPNHSFEEDLKARLYGRELHRFPKNDSVASGRINDLLWSITMDGLISVGVADKSKVLRILNAFMALLVVQGVPAFAIRESELIQVTMSPDDGKPLGTQASMILPRMLPLEMSFSRARWQEEMMPILEVSKIKNIWEELEKINNNDQLIDALILFGNIYTHFQREEYSETILFSWIMIDKWYRSNRNRISNLERSINKTSQSRKKNLINLLEAENEVDSQIIERLYDIYRLRSKVNHSFRDITKDDAKFALETALLILQRG